MDQGKLKTLLACIGIFVFMVGLSYAAVPLYNLFCRVTGYGGTTQETMIAPKKILDRQIKVSFTASTDQNLPWEFEPMQSSITVKVGEVGLAHYYAENLSDSAVTGMAVYNVTPDKAGKYFNKVHCFCFDQQKLSAGKKMPMPVTFFLDPALADDPAMDDVTEINLNYVFFKQ